MANYTMFWGCQIPARLPFVETSTRMILDRLGVTFQENAGFTCCPERELIRTADEELWHVAGTRNLVLAEQQGADILTACNGCYSTQKDIIYQLKRDPALKGHVNDVLSEVGLKYQSRVRAKHMVEFLNDDLGLAAVQAQVTKPLAGVKVAVHEGCHLLRPNPAINFDDPLKPVKFEAIIRALGGQVVQYSSRLMCCGQGFNAIEEPEKSAAMPAIKLRELHQLGAKALVTCCPTCFMQYDYKQALLRRQGENVDVPVFYLTELVALAFGFSGKEIGLELHRSDTRSFFTAWDSANKGMAMARKHFDLIEVEKCYNCGGCLQDCPPHLLDPSWNPNTIMGKIAAGEVEELLESKDIWSCLDCYICDERCPQRWAMRIAFETLKQLATERQLAPRGARNAAEGFNKIGKLIEPTESAKAQRARLGLPALEASDLSQFKKLQEVMEDRKKQAKASSHPEDELSDSASREQMQGSEEGEGA